MALSPGTRLGPYEVTAQIGVGGMGEVYRASDTTLKRQVAIKVLPASVAGDTGLAKALEPAAGSSPNLSMSPTITSPAMTQAGMILATAAYMSPEQARGRAVDKLADISAFGAVLFEMLKGAPAFGGDDVSEVLSRVLQREPAWEALPAGLPLTLVA